MLITSYGWSDYRTYIQIGSIIAIGATVFFTLTQKPSEVIHYKVVTEVVYRDKIVNTESVKTSWKTRVITKRTKGGDRVRIVEESGTAASKIRASKETDVKVSKNEELNVVKNNKPKYSIGVAVNKEIDLNFEGVKVRPEVGVRLGDSAASITVGADMQVGGNLTRTWTPNLSLGLRIDF